MSDRRGRRDGAGARAEAGGARAAGEAPRDLTGARPDGPGPGASVDEPRPTTTGSLRARFDPQIRTVSNLTQRTMALFPVRVWRHFLARNGFILSAGMSYQALFAVFAALYVVFAVAGVWLTGNEQAMDTFVLLIDTYAPGLVGPNGAISEDDLVSITQASTSLFGLTGAVALAGLIWTAIGWVTYARIAVRSMFGLSRDARSYVLLKARDLLVALAFGAVLLTASVLSIAATNFLGWFIGVAGWDPESGWSEAAVRLTALLVIFVIDTLALAVLYRFLSRAQMPWRRLVVGSLLASAGLSVMQLLSSLLIAGTDRNPLLATFAVFIALLLWFRLTSIVILVGACWIAVEASDANESLRWVTPEELEAERRQREYDALLTAARVGVREARNEVAAANWFERMSARRRLARAEAELERIEGASPEAVVSEPASDALSVTPSRSRSGRRGGRSAADSAADEDVGPLP